MNDNKKVTTLILIPVLLGILALTLTLVRQRQETRRGAADEIDLTMILNPQSVEVEKDKTFDVDFAVNTSKYLTSSSFIFCYTPNISVTSEDDMVGWTHQAGVSSKYTLSYKADLTENDGDNKCSQVVLLYMSAYDKEKMIPIDTLTNILKIKFRANEAGEGSVYLLTDSGDFAFTDQTKELVNFGKDVDEVLVDVVDPNATTPIETPVETPIETPVETPAPGIPDDEARVSVNFTFVGINTGSAPRCMASPEMDVLVVSGDAKVEKQVTAHLVKDTDYYNVAFDLGSDFVGKDNVSIFLKGPQHLRMKYGVDGQDSVYNELHGTLSIEGGKENSFDFTKFPLLGGDIAESKKDGSINGLDFSFMKKRANEVLSHKNKESTEMIWGDLNGDCVVNAADVALFLKSLVEKQDQTY